MLGYAGKQIRVDLETWEANVEDTSEEICRKYLGGAGYAAKILLFLSIQKVPF